MTQDFKYGSVCSGIEAATVAWESLGWKPAWFSEIEPFPCRLLAHYYAHVPNLGNMLKLHKKPTFIHATLDLLVGGTPCQSFSLAGLRGGLADLRGNLALQFCRLLLAKREQGKPVRWFVWENVPGALSSFSGEADGQDMEGIGPDHGRDIVETADFATLLAAFRECGYSCAWRMLDAQHFGIPQRRRRLFVVGHFGDDWRPSASVLFEPEDLRGHHSAQPDPKSPIAGTLTSSDARSRGSGQNPHLLVPCWWDGSQLSQTLDAVLAKGQMMPEKNRFPAVLQPIPINTNATSSRPGDKGRVGKGVGQEGDPAYTLSGSHSHAILQPLYFESRLARNGRGKLDHVAAPLKAQSGRTGKGDGAPLILYDLIVRRITPLEAERLQGFPDNYTLIPKATDTPRYKAIGNSMPVPVMRWIGQRIKAADKFFTPC